jgi:hypothetical protein
VNAGGDNVVFLKMASINFVFLALGIGPVAWAVIKFKPGYIYGKQYH